MAENSTPRNVDLSDHSLTPPLPAGLWREHLPLLAGTLSALLVSIRVLSAAGFDPETAYAILQAGGAASVILGAALSTIGVISMYATLASGHRLFLHSDTNVPERYVYIAVFIVSVVTAVFTAPAYIVILLGLLIALYFLVAYVLQPFFKWLLGGPTYEEERQAIRNVLLMDDPNLLRQHFGDPAERRKSLARSVRNGVIIIALSLAFFPVLSPPWMPAEVLTVKQSPPLVAYVISASPNEFVILTVSGRQVEYIPAPAVLSQKVCDAGGIPPPLPDLLSSRPRYPACPR